MSEDRDRRLARWLRQTLFFDVDDEGSRDDAAAQRLLAEVYRRSDARDQARRRRRRRLLGGAIVAGVMVSGSAAAALLWRNGQPTRPDLSVLCHASADLSSDAIAISPGADPVQDCGRLWASGQLPVGGQPDRVPPLVACVGPRGGIEVFPGPVDVCAQLGLEGADPTLSPDNAAIVALQERLVDEINLTDCRPVPEVVAAVEAALAESALAGWTVTVAPGAESAACGKVAVDTANRTVVVNEF